MPAKLRIFFAQVVSPGPFNTVTPPLGLLYLAAYLRERFSLDLCVVHQRLEGLSNEQLIRKILDYNPDIVALGCLTSSAHELPVITRALRDSKPDICIVLGGSHVTAVRDSALSETSADIAITGEGEAALEQVVQAYIAGDGMDEIPGLIHRDKSGGVVTNPGSQPLITNLDSLPFPAYDLIDMERYWAKPRFSLITGPKYITMFSSRGCPYECIFCNKTFGRNYRMHSPERIVEEIGYYKKRYGIEEVDFVDDCFNLNVKRVEDFTDLLLKEYGPVRMTFPSGLRSDLLNPDIIARLVQAGMYFIVLPLESGSPRLQKFIGKHLDISKYNAAVNACVEQRVFCHGSVIFGFPTETAGEMNNTFNSVVNSPLHTCAFFMPIAFPNSPLHVYVKTLMPEKYNMINYDGIDARNIGVNFSEVPDDEFNQFFKSLSLRFYLKPARIARIMRDYPNRLQLLANGTSFIMRRILHKV